MTLYAPLTGTDVDRRSVLGIGRVAALLALVALLAGGTLMAVSGVLLAKAPGNDASGPLREQPALFLSAAVLLALISLFDLFTIPALHHALRGYGRGLVLVATMTASVGDLLGVLGRLVQASEVPAAFLGSAEVALLAVLEQVLNTSGFVLVSVSFAAFGLLMLRGSRRWLGWVGLLAGGCTAIGQLPGLSLAFALANVAFFGWYVGLVISLREPLSRA
ncbi:MAG: hypothetical protein ACOH1Y_14535 [Propionicimonas sp.]